MPNENEDVLKTWVVEITTTGAEQAKADAQAVADAVEKQDAATEKVRRRSRAYLDDVRRVRAELDKVNRGQADGSLAAYTRRLRELGDARRSLERRDWAKRGAFADEVAGVRHRTERLQQGVQDKSLFALDAESTHSARVKATADLETRKDRVKSGEFAKQLAFDKKHTKELEQQEKIEKRIALQHKYGKRLGGLAADYGGMASGLGRAGNLLAGSALATGTGMVFRGMNNLGGTVEANRLQLETDLAARELANSFKPAVDTSTRALRGFREWLAKRSRGEQDAIMTGGLTLAGGFAANMLSRHLLGVGIGTLAARGVGKVAESFAASTASQAAGTAAGTAGASAVKNLAGGAAGGAAASRGAGLAGGLARLAGPLAVAYGLYEASENTATRRESGEAAPVARGNAAAELLVGSGIFSLLGGTPANTLATQNEEKNAKKERSTLTNAGAGFEETGSAYYRLSEKLSLTDNSLDGKDPTELLQLMLAELQKLTQPGMPNFNRPG